VSKIKMFWGLCSGAFFWCLGRDSSEIRQRLEVGSGLGLSLAHVIVRAHKGKIVVESTPGKGSTFTIIIPCISNTN
jgi:signal transduction histidine kinase